MKKLIEVEEQVLDAINDVLNQYAKHEGRNLNDMYDEIEVEHFPAGKDIDIYILKDRLISIASIVDFNNDHLLVSYYFDRGLENGESKNNTH